MTYSQKLRTPQWQRKRLEVMAAAGWKCEECGTRDRELQTHHVFYLPGKDPWDYPLALLMCLCDRCHDARQTVELDIFVNVATILREKKLAEIKEQPIWTMFTGVDEVSAPRCAK